MHLYGKKCSEFSNNISSGASGPNLLKFSYWASLGWGKQKIAKNGRSFINQDGPPMPIYGKKHLKIFFSRNRGCFGAESLHNSSGTEGSTKVAKNFDLFYGKGRLLPYAFIWEKKTFKNVISPKSRMACGWMFAIYHRERGSPTKVCLK